MTSEIEQAAEQRLLFAIGECESYCRGKLRQLPRAVVDLIAKELSRRLAADRAEAREQAKPIDAEIASLVGSAFVTVVSGDGRPRVQIEYATLEQAHAMHRALLGIAAKG